MEKATLTRGPSTDAGTFGVFRFGPLALHSLELPWRDNVRSLSCIPPGEYVVRWVWAPAWRGGRWVYYVTGTEPRSGILIHSANYAGDKLKGLRTHLEGCIALGEARGVLDGQPAVLLSAPAVRRFEEYAAGRPFLLEIQNNA